MAKPRVLIVESDPVVALHLQCTVSALGGEPLGPARAVAEAFEMLASEPCAVAVLDLNFPDERIFAVASEVANLGVPVLFACGPRVALVPLSRAERTPAKPYRAVPLRQRLRQLLQRPRV